MGYVAQDGMKKVLFIAYHFHPDLEIGAVRSVKFAKFLPAFGWQAHVVSVHTDYYDRVETAPLPFHVAVERAGMWPTPLTFRRWVIRTFHALASRLGPSHTERIAGLAPPSPPSRVNGSLRRLLVQLFSTPDPYVGWLVPAVWLALKVARREKADVIYTSGPPHTAHLVGLFASYLSGLPLVVDFRDPWTSRPGPSDPLDRGFFSFQRYLESRLIRRASLVLTTTEDIAGALCALHSLTPGTDCVAILNGFDADDFPAVQRHASTPAWQPVSFVYAGTLYGGRDPRPFLVALGELMASSQIASDAVTVDFYGPVEIETAPLQGVLDEYSLHEVVRFKPSVTRDNYLRVIGDADALILIQGDDTPWAVPAKTFEYLATGNEILLLAGSYALAGLLRDFPHAHRADVSDVPGIKACILGILERFASGTVDRAQNARALSHLHKRELTREFAHRLDAVVTRR